MGRVSACKKKSHRNRPAAQVNKQTDKKSASDCFSGGCE